MGLLFGSKKELMNAERFFRNRDECAAFLRLRDRVVRLLKSVTGEMSVVFSSLFYIHFIFFKSKKQTHLFIVLNIHNRISSEFPQL